MRAGLLKAIRRESTRGVDSPKNARVKGRGLGGGPPRKRGEHPMVERESGGHGA